jgi:hypothetical protein
MTEVIISGIVSLIIGMLVGRYGLMRNITAYVDSTVNQKNTAAQIALTREQTDHQAVTSLHSQISSLIDLLSKQLVQQAQTSIQQAQLESEKITAQNNLSLAMRDVTDEMRSNQRTSATNIETILSSYGRSIDRVELGFRSVSEEMLLTNSSFTRMANQMVSDMGATRSMFDTVSHDISAIRKTALLGQENLDELLEIFIDVRNTILKALRFNKTAIIRPRNDNRFQPIPPDLALKPFEVRGNNNPVEPDPSQEDKPAKPDDIQIDNAVLPAEEQNNEPNSP